MVEQVIYFQKPANVGKSMSVDRIDHLLFALRFGTSNELQTERRAPFYLSPTHSKILDAWMFPNARGHFLNDNTRSIFWSNLNHAVTDYSKDVYEKAAAEYWFRETADGIVADIFAKPGKTVSINYTVRGGRPGNRKARRQGKG